MILNQLHNILGPMTGVYLVFSSLKVHTAYNLYIILVGVLIDFFFSLSLFHSVYDASILFTGLVRPMIVLHIGKWSHFPLEVW